MYNIQFPEAPSQEEDGSLIGKLGTNHTGNTWNTVNNMHFQF